MKKDAGDTDFKLQSSYEQRGFDFIMIVRSTLDAAKATHSDNSTIRSDIDNSWVHL